MDCLLWLVLVAISRGPLVAQAQASSSVYANTSFILEVSGTEKCAPTTVGTFRTNQNGQSGKTIWQRSLVNNPHFAWIDERGRWVVTVGTECVARQEHAIVVYDRSGEVVADLALDEVLTAEEQRRVQSEPNTGGRILFHMGARFEFEDKQVWVLLPWGRRSPLLK